MKLNDNEIMLLWEQGVVGSNPTTPTVENQGVTNVEICSSFLFAQNLHKNKSKKDIQAVKIRSSNRSIFD